MTDGAATLSRREFSDADVQDRVLSAIRAHGGRVTEADLTVHTGLPPDVISPALRALLLEFDSVIEVNADGDPVYAFDPALARRDDDRGRRWRAFWAKLWAGFRVAYKVAIAVVLIAYFTLFVILVVAAIVAVLSQRTSGSSSSSSSSRSSSSGSGFGDMLFWAWIFGDSDHRRHRRAYRTSRRASRRGLTSQSIQNRSYSGRWVSNTPQGLMAASRAGAPNAGRPFYEKVFSFVFGQDDEERDELFTEKQLLAFIRACGGVVSPSELSSRTGWSIRAAERESTRLIARYEGDVHVSEDGQMLFVFPALLSTAGADATDATPPAPPVWERYETPLTVTGNTGGANAGIAFLNLFVLVGASLLIPGFAAPVLGIDMAAPAAQIGLYIVPLIYSGLFFAVPLGRWLFHVIPENRRRAARNVRRALMQHVFGASIPEARPLLASSTERVRGLLPPAAATRDTSDADLAARLGEFAHEYEADISASDDGDTVYCFDRIASEHRAATAIREATGPLELAHLGRNVLLLRSA